MGRKQDTRYLAETYEDGTIVLIPAVTVSAVELAVLADPESRDVLRQAVTGPRPPLKSRGSFADFVDDDA